MTPAGRDVTASVSSGDRRPDSQSAHSRYETGAMRSSKLPVTGAIQSEMEVRDHESICVMTISITGHRSHDHNPSYLPHKPYPGLGYVIYNFVRPVLSHQKENYWMYPIKAWQEASPTQTLSSFSSGVTILHRRDDMISNQDGQLYR